MKEIRIIHLFPKLLSLYGEYGNVAVLKKTLEDRGFEVYLEQWEQWQPDAAADLIYVGSGTEDNLLEALKRLMPYKDEIAACVENGNWLVTGNAMALFGQLIDCNPEQVPALGVFSYKTRMDRKKRYIGDVLAETAGEPVTVGFVNTSNVYEGIEKPVYTLTLNPQLGSNKKEAGEGFCEKGFFATQLIGPLLAKNPHLLIKYFKLLTGQDLVLPADSNICKAYDICLSELTKRKQ